MAQAIPIPNGHKRDDAATLADSSSPSQPMRLFPRRGSMAAPNPWAVSPALSPNPTGASDGPSPGAIPPSSSVSRITIVRVPDAAVSDEQPADFGLGSPAPVNRPGRSNSWGSNHSASSAASSRRTPSPGSSKRAGGGRMSFAFASFTPINPVSDNSQSGSAPSPLQSPTSSTRRRRSLSNANAPLKPHLTPQQLYDLAMDSTAPSAPASPVQSFGAHSRPSSRPTTPGMAERVQPAVFTAVPDEVFLPFMNRPVEVRQLLTEPPTSRLFHLLEALFPLDMRSPKLGESSDPSGEEDPKQWTFEHLSYHLMDTTRAEVDDQTWVELARICIRNRSEALWERFKGALGVPPELDADQDQDLEEEFVADEDVVAAAAALDAGFSGFEAPEPKPASNSGEGHLELPSASSDAFDPSPYTTPVDGRDAFLEPVFVDGDSEPEELAGAQAQQPGYFSSAVSDGGWSHRQMENIREGEEEPADEKDTGDDVKTPATTSVERNVHFNVESNEEHAPDPTTINSEDPFGTGHALTSREIRALQITTAPSTHSVGNMSQSSVSIASAISSPVSQKSHPLDAHLSVSPAAPTTHGLLPSPGSAEMSVSPNLSASFGRAASPLAARLLNRPPSHSIRHGVSNKEHSSSSLHSEYRGFGGYGLAPADTPYHPALSERGPGNPLFPSSFADLSVAPTLVANIPKSSRSASLSHTSHYPPSLAHGNVQGAKRSASPGQFRRMTLGGAGGRRSVGTWSDIKDKYEYAVTVASASSDGGRG